MIFFLYQWDSAGREKFRPMTVPFYRGTQGIMVVFDLTNPVSGLSKIMIETAYQRFTCNSCLFYPNVHKYWDT